jgi:hypothetical protein
MNSILSFQKKAVKPLISDGLWLGPFTFLPLTVVSEELNNRNFDFCNNPIIYLKQY